MHIRANAVKTGSMHEQMSPRGLIRVGIVLAVVLGAAPTLCAQPIEFRLTFPNELREAPFTGPVYLMFDREDGERRRPREPRFGPNWFNVQPFFRIDARDWKPGEPLTFRSDVPGIRGRLGSVPAGSYKLQGVLRSNLDVPEIGSGEGSLYSAVRTVVIEAGNHEPIDLVLDQVVSRREAPDDERIKYVEVRSNLLSDFHGRDVRMRAGVLLPIGYAAASARRYPSLYVIPGFGGDHGMARMMKRMMPDDLSVVTIVPDPSAFTGHHVFADSANNGPWGRALLEELIPHLEKTFRIEPSAEHRYVSGISSGGWSSLWLQVTYPDAFAGVWSFAPDPVDFRDFQRINIYAPDANMFRDERGERRPLARRGDQVMLWYDDFSAMDDVIGCGGQLHSFEAVFSPKGSDGKPRRLWDRTTGAIDPLTATAWEKYDIRLVLERGGPELIGTLQGKLHIIAGDEDTFYLEGAVKRLAGALEELGSDARVELLADTDHGGTFSRARLAAIERTITERFATASNHD